MEPSPDGYRLAYKKFTDQGQYVFFDGQEQGPYDEIEFLDFSPDSQHLVYVAKLGDMKFAVLDGIGQTQYEDIAGSVVFSPDSQRIAYTAKNGKKSIAIINGKEFIYDDIRRGINFSPNGQHFAFVAPNLNADNFVVLDGKEGLPSDSSNFNIVFSPDSQHVVYEINDVEIYFLVLDGEKSEGYHWIKNITFSPNSNHLLFVARDDGTWDEYVVMDGMHGKKYDEIISRIYFDSEDSFHYMAILNDEVYLVEEIIK
jgi:WD40 repeat protein